MRRVNPFGWSVNLGSGLILVGCGIVVAVTLHRAWSWPLFVWGAALGPVASAWAYFSLRAFSRNLIKRRPAQRESLMARERTIWPKYRATYAGMVLLGIGLGIISAASRNPLGDAAFTAMWVLAGVLPPLIAWPMLMRRAAIAPPVNRSNDPV
jgi:hypothetical protein